LQPPRDGDRCRTLPRCGTRPHAASLLHVVCRVGRYNHRTHDHDHVLPRCWDVYELVHWRRCRRRVLEAGHG
jgi:hypothetical protein